MEIAKRSIIILAIFLLTPISQANASKNPFFDRCIHLDNWGAIKTYNCKEKYFFSLNNQAIALNHRPVYLTVVGKKYVLIEETATAGYLAALYSIQAKRFLWQDKRLHHPFDMAWAADNKHIVLYGGDSIMYSKQTIKISDDKSK